MACATQARGEPYVAVEPKRSYDNVPIQVDWHDYLSRIWQPGTAQSASTAIRLPRAQSTGLQYRALADGVTGRRQPRWPLVVGGQVSDGQVTWVAEEITPDSLRTSILSDGWAPVIGLVFGASASADLIFTQFVDGGVSGETYEVKHQIICANGEEKEAVALLLVED